MTCPICQKPTTPEYRPFCSKRCADVDLGRWITGAYVVPGDEEVGSEVIDITETPDPTTRH